MQLSVIVLFGIKTVAAQRQACSSSLRTVSQTVIDCQNRTNRALEVCESFIHIAGIFPLSNTIECFDGVQSSIAAQTAVDDINAGAPETGQPVHRDGENLLFDYPDAWEDSSGVDQCTSQNMLMSEDGICCTRTSEGVAADAPVIGDYTGGKPACKSYCLIMHKEDSQSDPGMALFRADSFMNSPWTSYASVDMFIGGMSSEVSESLQQLLQHNKIPQISYASTSPMLSDKTQYPTFLRTIPSDEQLIAGVTEMIQYFEWKMVSILAINNEFGQAGATELATVLSGLNSATVLQRVEVVNNLLFTDDDVAEQLRIIKESESRIIFLHCSIHQAKAVFKAAASEELEMLSEEFTWLGSEWAQDTIWEEWGEGESEWTQEDDDMKEAMNGIVAFRAGGNCLASASTTNCAATRWTSDKVLEEETDIARSYHCDVVRESVSHVNQFAYFAYDAVVVGATALHRSLKKGNSLSDFPMTFEELRGMENGDMGIDEAVLATGSVFVDDKGDRVMPFDVVNLQDGEWVHVGSFHVDNELTLDMTTDADKAIKWAGGQTRIPSDRTEEHVSLAALYLFFMLTFIVLSICAGNFLHAHEFYVLPESGAAVLFGLTLGGVLMLWGSLFGHTEELTNMTQFDTEIFSLILLPIIIFSAGFNLRKSDFINNLVPICMTAFIGTSISSCFVGGVIFFWGRDNWLGGFSFGSLGGAESLAFGALISAVDPVATLAVFGALGVETDLNMRVFGESVINDGVSIVLFRTFCKYIVEDVTTESIIDGIIGFVLLLVGSVVFGLICAVFLAFVMKYARLVSHLMEVIMVLLGSYMAYAAAEAMHYSGIIASLVAGIAMNHWTYHNFTYDGEVLARRTVKMLSLIADTVIFFQVGQNIVVSVAKPDWGFIGVTLALCLLGRILNIIPLCGLYNLCTKEENKIPMNHQLVMIHAGLRGGIAFFVALGFPSQHIHIVINTCMWVILFTIFVLGGTCVAFLNMMNVKMGVESHDVQDVKKSKHSKEIKGCAQSLDRKILLPCVTWRFESDGNDTYIENPAEARAFRKAIPYEPNQH
eukprot:SAG31_NODE_2293_length_5994_cov_2.611535_3_plen_1054_part_00